MSAISLLLFIVSALVASLGVLPIVSEVRVLAEAVRLVLLHMEVKTGVSLILDPVGRRMTVDIRGNQNN